MRRMFLLTMAALCVSSPLALQADEKHVEIKVTNGFGDRITLRAFDGDDGSCSTPASTKSLHSDETATIKCDGKGRHRCKLGMRSVGDGTGDNSVADKNWCDQPVKDGQPCTIERNLVVKDGQMVTKAKLTCD